jgi:homoserine kinase type II
MKSVYLLQHLHGLPDGYREAKLIGVYRSAEAAKEAIGRLQEQPGFRDHPRLVNPLRDKGEEDDQGFYIDEYEVDKDHWAEGYPMTPTWEMA